MRLFEIVTGLKQIHLVRDVRKLDSQQWNYNVIFCVVNIMLAILGINLERMLVCCQELVIVGGFEA